MNDERWQLLKGIFDQARELPDAEQQAFIETTCGYDPVLLAEAQRLLDAYDSEFLEEPSIADAGRILSTNIFESGKQIGRYRLRELIGEGGMGQVFLADDTELDRPVAFKFLHSDVATDEERVRRFIQEAKAASALNHPNILTIYEIGTFEGARFIVSDFIDGETLRDRMRHGLKVSETIDITCQMAAALQAAHSAGIVHRDIKPENVMIRRDGLVKVLDFGLAKLTEADDRAIEVRNAEIGMRTEDSSSIPQSAIRNPHLTAPGLVMGTVAYMSPEQARGQSVDARSDLWSLGVVFHEMLTGHSPFEGESVTELITSILKTDRTVVDDAHIPTELRPICRKALTGDKTARYQSADDLLRDLQGEKKRMEYAIDSTPYMITSGIDDLKTELIRRRPTLSAEYIVTSVKRHKFATFGAIAVVLTSAIAFSVYTFNGATPSMNGKSSSAAIGEHTTEKDLDISRLPSSGRIFKIAISPDGKFAAYTTGLSEEGARLHVTELETKRDVEIVPAPTEKQAPLDNLVFTPDSSRVMYRYRSGYTEDVLSVPVAGGKAEKLPFAYRAASFSPNGKLVAFHRPLFVEGKKWLGYDLVLADPDGGNERVLLHNLDGSEDFLWLGVPQWSNDGKWIAAWDWRDKSRGRLYAVNTQDGTRQAFSDQEWSDITGVTWTPDGNLVVAARELGAQRNSPTQLWLVTKTTARRITNDPHGYTELSGTRDGRTLLTTQQIRRNDLWVMTGADARTARQVTHSGEVGGGFVSLPDGGVLVVSRINQNMSFWRMNLDGTGRQQLRSDDGLNLNPRPTRDGRYIVFNSSKNARDYSVFRINSDGSGLMQLAEMAMLIDVSSDGRWAYYHHLEGKQRVISKVPVEGGPSIVVAKLDRPSQRYAISQDGRIAEVYGSPTGETSGGLRIFSPDGKELKRFPLTTIDGTFLIHWTPDGKGVAYKDTREEGANVWVMAADGKRPARPLTNFTSPGLNAFDFSFDGKKMFVTRATITNDALLIRSGQE